MNDFLEKSRDLYFSQPDEYAHFLDVFETIRQMAVAKNYYYTDLFNIEEILSLLEMQENLGSDHPKRLFLRYISDVISFYTPRIDRADLKPNNWGLQLFGSNTPWNLYGYFVGSILGLRFSRRQDLLPVEVGRLALPINYSVVTLNYDLVLESVCNYINRQYRCTSSVDFVRTPADLDYNKEPLILAKLHGSIDSGDIVPPTWNKGLGQPGVISSWRLAYRALSKANYVRIIGYSLPSSDLYIKYLLRSAAIEAPHLKRIDVLCYDPDGSVKNRYDDFISFANCRFVSGRTEHYLQANFDRSGQTSPKSDVVMDKLEVAHKDFFDRLA